MPVNWTYAKAQVAQIVSSNGTSIEWLSRVTSGSAAYITGSTITAGYGDDIVFWITGSATAIIEHSKSDDILVPAGFYEDDFDRLYIVDPNLTIKQWDQMLIPSGSANRYLVLNTHLWRMADVLVGQYFDVRRLIPRSGSQY